MCFFTLDPLLEPRGPSYWKLNTSILSDEEIRGKIRHLISHSFLQEKSGEDFLDGWEHLKISMKSVLVSYSRCRARTRRAQNEMLEKSLARVKLQLQEKPDDEGLLLQLDELYGQLKRIEIDKVKGVLLHSNYRDICLDQCNLFTVKKLQKQSVESKHFYAIRNKNGETLYKTREIVKEIRNQMVEVFAAGETFTENADEFLSADLPCLSKEDRQIMEEEIRPEEIAEAINGMPKGKTPGGDGLPIELYQCFADLLIPLLLKLYNECLKLGHMTYSMHSGLISLLYKGKGLKVERSNWRPLTMLNVDYKILAKVWMIRLKTFMPLLIHPDQTCAVPERDIRDGLLNLYNVVETTRLENRHGCLFSVDHMAAFDVIEWEYIFKVLQAFGLGKFVEWIKMIYSHNHVFSAVQVNGYISAPFRVTRGIRQGCPLSCALYVLVSETVLNFIRKDHLVRGMVIQGIEHKLNSLADDTNLTLENYQSVLRVLTVYRCFKLASGATLKEAKNQLLMLGTSTLEEVPQQLREYVVDKLK
ncbi:MAG: reverse transcriptase family protein, partial [PVC group bacterium]|nr:reverse transcriptase family protein [PVC group bacterium]